MAKCTNYSIMSKVLDVHSRDKNLGVESEPDIKRQKTNEKLAKRLIKWWPEIFVILQSSKY